MTADLAHRAPEQSTVTVLRVAAGAAERLDPAERGPLAERFRGAHGHRRGRRRRGRQPLPRALLLAGDHRITDPSILRQLG